MTLAGNLTSRPLALTVCPTGAAGLLFALRQLVPDTLVAVVEILLALPLL